MKMELHLENSKIEVPDTYSAKLVGLMVRELGSNIKEDKSNIEARIESLRQRLTQIEGIKKMLVKTFKETENFSNEIKAEVGEYYMSLYNISVNQLIGLREFLCKKLDASTFCIKVKELEPLVKGKKLHRVMADFFPEWKREDTYFPDLGYKMKTYSVKESD